MEKKIKITATLIVLIIVATGLSFRARTPNFKLYTCSFILDSCLLTDVAHNYTPSPVCPFIPNATVTDQGKPIGPCADNCPGINACPE
jgi:hypothetical protein